MSNPKMNNIGNFTLMAILLAPVIAQAQPLPTAPNAVASPSSAGDILTQVPATSANDRISPLSAFSLEAATQGSTATLKYGGDLARLNNGEGTFGSYSISLSTPVAESGAPTLPITLDGLANATSVKLEVSQLIVPAVTYTGDAAIEGRICTAMIQAAAKKRPEQPAPICATATVAEFLGAEEAKNFNAARNAAYASRILTYRGLSGRVGYKELKFYDPVTLEKGALDRTPWQVGGFWGWIAGDLSWSVTGEYQHEVSYEQAPQKTACRATTGPVISCVTGALGRAEQRIRDEVSLEVGRALGESFLWTVRPTIGVKAKVTYDLNNDEWGVGLPIYMFGDKNGLTGGLRADWGSKSGDIVVGVFLNARFSILDD